MPYCPGCGKATAEHARFCPNCGTSLYPCQSTAGETKGNRLVINKNDYTVVINKDDGTVVLTYKRRLVAKAKNSWLMLFAVCVVVGITQLITTIPLWSTEVGTAMAIALCAMVFFIIGGRFFFRAFLEFRTWLREFEGPASEERK